MKTFEDRFWDKVDKNGPNGCWLWTGAKSSAGYGNLARKIGGRYYHYAPHRLSHEWYIGPIPDGYHVHHNCGTRACCNPAHLEAKKIVDHVRGHRPEMMAAMEIKKQNFRVCKKGHKITGDNIHYFTNGRRQCEICYQERQLKYAQDERDFRARVAGPAYRRPRNGVRPPEGEVIRRYQKQSHCPHDHEFNDDNTRWLWSRDHWTRVCRACHSKRTSKSRRKRRLETK